MSEKKQVIDELERIKIVRDLAILDTPSESVFDEVVKFAGDLCQTRYVVLTLADTERLWFKSKLGLDICEVQREISMCNHTLVNNTVLEIEDARQHPVFCDNPLVNSELNIRFYTGIPIRLDSNVAIGTLCVLDDKPRVLSPLQKTGLQLMAQQVTHLLESRNSKIQARKEADKNKESEQIIHTTARINREYLNGIGKKQLMSDLLEDLLSITESQFGFIAEVKHNSEQQPFLKNLAISDISWDTQSSDYYNKYRESGIEFHNLDTLFGAALKTGADIITNNAAQHPESTGTPFGHPELQQFAGFPLYQQGTMVGMVGLANREAGYDAPFTEFIRPLLDNCGLIINAFRAEAENQSYLQDLEKEKSAFQNLSDKFSSLYHSMDDGIVECTVPDGLILDCNPAFCAMLGYELGELLNKTIFDISASTSLHKSRTILQQSIPEKGESEAFEKDYVHKSGRPIPALVKVFKVNTSPQHQQRAWALIKDLRVQKKRDSQRAQRNKMESLGTLSGGIAHDFNNILAIISGNAELLNIKVEDESSQSYTAKILEASNRGADLVRRILTFSRKGPVNNSAIDFAKGMEQALELILPTIPKNIEIKKRLTGSGLVVTDESQITQLLMNLISNASQAIEPECGTITIELQEVENPNCGKFFLELAISDTGVGMTEQQIERAFDPFYTTKEKGRGTGLGLAIVHGLVADMKGSIAIDSQKNQGCKITITLPISHPGLKHTKLAPICAESVRHSVLIVEDEVEIAHLYKESLQDDGHQVYLAHDGEAGLTLFEQHKDQIDIVISDDQMPKMRGIEMSRIIKLKAPSTPIVLLSGFVSDHIEEALTAGHINLVLAKPLALNELRNTIKQFKVVKTNCC